MGVTRRDNQDGLTDGVRVDEVPAPVRPPDFATSTERPTQLLVGSVGNGCANCGVPLASDQRYCVQCGERRGKSRFAVTGADRTTSPPAPAPVAVVAPDPPRRRAPYGATLIAGVATLLLALGVGVEIGQL
ncbi:MAG TPA: hypothetical protein VE127_13680, partial [Solirubrobacteraceae bacterium]|nr:hypothetical protein [Solirubrobacteraceae bacterium]